MNELPKGWAQTTLGELGTWSSGGTPKKSNSAYYGGTIPWVKTGDLNDGVLLEIPQTITELGLQDSSAKLFPKGTLLVAMYGATIGKTAVLGKDASTNQACAALLPYGATAELIPFLWRYFLSIREYLKALGQGGAQPNISQTIIKAIGLDLPPAPEQIRIVEKLDSLSASSSRAREELAHIPRLASRYKETLLTTIFSTADQGDLRTLEELTDPAAPIRYGVLQPGDQKEGGVPLVRVLDLIDGRVKWNQLRTIAPEIDDKYSKARIEEGDVLVSVVGTIGRVAVVRGLSQPTNIARAISRIRPRPNFVLSEWLAYRLQANDCQSFLAESAREVARKTLNVGQLKQLSFQVPEIPVQEHHLEIIRNSLSKIDGLSSVIDKSIHLLDKLNQSILAKAFRGELVPQDPNDEPASVLLDRIRAERAATPKPKRTRKSATDQAARAPRRKAAMTKSRQDEDVLHKPYLAMLLRENGGTAEAEDLFKQSKLPVADFYKQLAWEVEHGHINDDENKLEAA